MLRGDLFLRALGAGGRERNPESGTGTQRAKSSSHLPRPRPLHFPGACLTLGAPLSQEWKPPGKTRLLRPESPVQKAPAPSSQLRRQGKRGASAGTGETCPPGQRGAPRLRPHRLARGSARLGCHRGGAGQGRAAQVTRSRRARPALRLQRSRLRSEPAHWGTAGGTLPQVCSAHPRLPG